MHRGSLGQSGGDKGRRVWTGVLRSVVVNTEGKVEGKGLREDGIQEVKMPGKRDYTARQP